MLRVLEWNDISRCSASFPCLQEVSGITSGPGDALCLKTSGEGVPTVSILSAFYKNTYITLGLAVPVARTL